MGRHRNSPLRIVGITTAMLLTGVAVAPQSAAFNRGVTSPPLVDSDGDHVDVELAFQRRGGVLHVTTSRGGAAETAWGCELRVVILPGVEGTPLAEQYPLGVEGAIPVRITCGSALVQDRWLTPGEIQDVDAEAAGIAATFAQSVLAPSLNMGNSPPSNVLVGLFTWFWIDGWDGSPQTTTVVAPWGQAVTVELSLSQVTWGFGDESPSIIAGLGQPYPDESDVQHLYTVRSTSPSDPDGSYVVTAEVEINVQYWVDTGEGPYAIDPLTVDLSNAVVVRQLQAVLR